MRRGAEVHRSHQTKQRRGDNLHTPVEIEVDQVIVYALDDLNILNLNDEHIQTSSP